MLEFLLATLISISAGVREPRLVSDAPFDYELSYKIENTYKGFEGSFKHDYEREDGQFFNDIRVLKERRLFGKASKKYGQENQSSG